MRYERFDGHEQRDITLSDEGEHTFTVTVETNSGTLALSILDSAGAVVYNGSELPSSTFEVAVSGAGKYTIQFDAEDHNGSFHVAWE